MLKKIVFLFLIVFTALLQISFLGVAAGVGGFFDLLLISTLVLAFRGYSRESYFYAFWGGFFLDWFGLRQTTGLTGLFLVLTLIFWGLSRRFASPRYPFLLLFLLVASFLQRVVWFYPSWSFSFGWLALLAAVGDVVLAVLFLAPLTALFRYLFEENYWQLDFRNRL